MRSVSIRKVLTLPFIVAALLFTAPSFPAFAEEGTPNPSASPSVSEGAPGHEEGETLNGVHREPADHIKEEHHGPEGLEVFLIGGAIIIAIGLAFYAGRKTRRKN